MRAGSGRRPAAALGLALAFAALGWAAPAAVLAPAAAAGCSSGAGVTVVVDYGRYGGVQTGCAGDPTNGLSVLSQAGFAVVQVTTQPGFVCRIEGVPPAEDDACVRAPSESAYWSYWQAAPGSSNWTYSTLGVASTQPPDGATEGWSYGAGSPPGVAPPANTTVPPPPPPPPSTTSARPPAPPGGDAGQPSAAPTGGRPTASDPAGTDPAGSQPTTTGPGAADPSTATSAGPTTAPPPSGTSGATSTGPPGTGTSSTGSRDDVQAGPTVPTDPPEGGTRWGALLAVAVAAVLAAGAFWQVRRRR